LGPFPVWTSMLAVAESPLKLTFLVSSISMLKA
jgi:hypothetical protein